MTHCALPLSPDEEAELRAGQRLHDGVEHRSGARHRDVCRLLATLDRERAGSLDVERSGEPDCPYCLAALRDEGPRITSVNSDGTVNVQGDRT